MGYTTPGSSTRAVVALLLTGAAAGIGGYRYYLAQQNKNPSAITGKSSVKTQLESTASSSAAAAAAAAAAAGKNIKGSRPRRVVADDHHMPGSLSQHRRCWRHNEDTGCLEPAWPREPDIDVVRELAVACLPQHLFAAADIAMFAQGSFHRLYTIASPLSPVQYLMRVALPVDPFFKTESEVATMHYIRQRFSLPVPSIVAYSSSASNALGFEWILMEKVKGVALDTVWDQMSFHTKNRLTVDFAGHIKQLCERRFSLLGNIYFADVWNQVGYRSLSFDGKGAMSTDRNFGTDGDYVIGTMVSNRFTSDKRVLLRSDRGPFDTSKDLVTSESKLLGQLIRQLSASPDDDYYCEVDEVLSADGAEVIEVHSRLHGAIERIFGGGNGPEDAGVLWHFDLSRMNVLVDERTHRLVSVVDWESVSIVPAFETGGAVPLFLKGIEVSEPLPRGSLSDEEEWGQAPLREDWELVLLRRKYREIVQPLYNATSDTETRVALKLDMLEFLARFTDVWQGVQYWLDEHELEDA